ncbi:hypothetical protein GCM10007417_26410 [Glycocaulis alkaliphilus]|nr:hypothetical protein GCM10007417_26410 [Glycocaulis alkaliphilus]
MAHIGDKHVNDPLCGIRALNTVIFQPLGKLTALQTLLGALVCADQRPLSMGSRRQDEGKQAWSK